MHLCFPTSTWLQAAAKTTSKDYEHPPALGGNTSYEYQHRLGYSKVMDPGMALSSMIGHSGPSRRSDLECGLFCIFGLPHLRSQLGWSRGGATIGGGGGDFICLSPGCCTLSWKPHWAMAWPSINLSPFLHLFVNTVTSPVPSHSTENTVLPPLAPISLSPDSSSQWCLSGSTTLLLGVHFKTDYLMDIVFILWKQVSM